ncbi:hypothetical protein CRYUN_Cryun40dG0035400 [Craigia yunnanensis]
MFNEMLVYGQFPILSTYNTVVLCGLCKNGHIEEAIDLFHSLENTKYKPSIELFNILIGGMCKAGTSEEARKCLLKSLRKVAYQTPISFNIIIHGLLREKEVEKAMNRLKETCRRNFSPDEAVTSMLLRLAMKDAQ